MRPSGIIEPSAVDDRSFTGVASMGNLQERVTVNIPSAYGGTIIGDPLVSNFTINDDFEVEFRVLRVARVNLDRGPAVK